MTAFTQNLRPLVVGWLCLNATVLAGSNSNSLMSISSDGRLIACSNRDSRSVAVIESATMKRVFETTVGSHPEGTTFIGDTETIACCVYGDDRIVVIDSNSGEIVRTINVFDEPYGIVSSEDGRFLYVTLEYPGQVLAISTDSWTVQQSWNVGRMLRGIALSPDGESVFITEYLTTDVLRVATKDGTVLERFRGGSTDNLARQLVVHPNLPKVYVPHVRSKVSASHGNGSIFPYVSVATYAGPDHGRRMRIPMDSFRGTRVVANPWEVALSPDGNQVYTIFGATNDMYIASVQSDDYQEISYVATVRLGNNPRAVAVAPDGNSFYVYNALDFEVVRYDTRSMKTVGKASVTDNPLTGEHLLGKKLFYTARQPMSGRQWISCSSCHIDGDADGRTWQQPEGLRQTQPLAGLAWTHPLHWSADRDEVQDFEHTIRGKLMQGRGLLSGTLPNAMAEPISGRSQMLDALAVYTNSHDVPLSPHAADGLSESALRGKRLFESAETKCSTCHSGPYYTDSQPGSQTAMHDVGTGRNDSSELMGTKYDTPTLLGVYRSAPYLHDGSAQTLADVLTTGNANDKHGITTHLSSADREDLVEFLKALPYEAPEPIATQQGLQKVTK